MGLENTMKHGPQSYLLLTGQTFVKEATSTAFKKSNRTLLVESDFSHAASCDIHDCAQLRVRTIWSCSCFWNAVQFRCIPWNINPPTESHCPLRFTTRVLCWDQTKGHISRPWFHSLIDAVMLEKDGLQLSPRWRMWVLCKCAHEHTLAHISASEQ